MQGISHHDGAFNESFELATPIREASILETFFFVAGVFFIFIQQKNLVDGLKLKRCQIL